MTPSRRSVIHPPVLSTQEHAEAEAAFFANTRVQHKTGVIDPQIAAPKKPTLLWAAASEYRYAACTIDCVPDRLHKLVAPVVEVRVHI